MKKLLTLTTMFLILIGSSCNYDDTGIWNSINNLEQRVLELEKTCKEINSNISAMQAILTALQNNDYVTSIVQVTENGKTIGYTINFSKSGSVTIYHGENGKDGANGTDGKDGVDGKDGYTPVIGVRQHTDGIYYWTLDGEWLTDENGNKIKAIGTDGKDGVNGTDGKDGADGKDGVNGADGKDGADGITPQLKIENDYWYISYDNGATWTILDKATGEDGKDGVNGNDGKDGVDGDSFFSSVTFDDKYIYLTLSDGTEIVVPMVDDSPLANLKSVVFIPRYSDGKATITIKEDDTAVVEFDFMVAPASLASIIAENYESMLTISAVLTETRAANFINMPVISCTSDDNGIISITASANELDLMKDNYAILTISDGKNSITSESVEITGADPMEVEFSMVASNITPYSTDIAITVSDESVYYAVSLLSPEGFNEEEFVALFNEEFDSIMEMTREFDPTATVASVLRQYYWNGSQSLQATGLYPETELMGVIFVLDIKTGHVARVIKFEDLATTPSLGSVTPSIELVGYYSGDEEAGSVFGDPLATRGKAITVVKYDNFDGAHMLFTTLAEGYCTNVTMYPDTDLWAITMGYWSTCKINEPYTFYLVEWNKEITALVYATDSTGQPASFGRLLTKATTENKSPINELKTLYNSIFASTYAFNKASVVVGEPRQNKGTTHSTIQVKTENNMKIYTK